MVWSLCHGNIYKHTKRERDTYTVWTVCFEKSKRASNSIQHVMHIFIALLDSEHVLRNLSFQQHIHIISSNLLCSSDVVGTY